MGTSPLTSDQLVEIANILAKIMLPTIEVAVRTAVSEVFKQQLNNTNNDQTSSQTLWRQPPVGTTPSHDFFLKLSNQNVLDRELIERKSRSAVIKKLPQLATDVEDIDKIKSIVSECKLLNKLDPSAPPHRHPSNCQQSQNLPNTHPKITRVFFVDKKSRDLFLYRFYIAKRKNSSIPSNVFCRRLDPT